MNTAPGSPTFITLQLKSTIRGSCRECYRKFPKKTLIGHAESHVHFYSRRLKGRNFTMIGNPSRTVWQSGSIGPPRKSVEQTNKICLLQGVLPRHYLNKAQLSSGWFHAPGFMRHKQQITYDMANLHQEMGWHLKGGNSLMTPCKKDT